MIRTQPFSDEKLQYLVEQLNRGNVDVLWVLVDGYRSRLKTTLMLHHKELLELTEEADEAIIDAFINLVRRWPLSEPVRNYKSIEGWLTKVVVRWSIDNWRRRKAERRHLDRGRRVDNIRIPQPHGSGGWDRSMDEAVDRFEQDLDPASRLIWVGSIYHEETYEQMAERLGWTRDKVKHHLSRLRDDLRSFLGTSGTL